MSEQRFKTGRNAVIAYVRMFGNGAGMCVASAAERRLFRFGKRIGNAPERFCLSCGAYVLRGFKMQRAHRKTQRFRKVRAHIKVVYRVAEISKRQRGQGKRIRRPRDLQSVDNVGMHTHTNI